MTSHLSLLILPGLPYPATAESIEAAHGKTISSVISKFNSGLKNGPSHGIQRLDIALATPTSTAPELSHFDHWQSVVALLYQTICAKAANEGLDLDTESGLDIRIFIVDTSTTPQVEEDPTKVNIKQGPIIDIPTLALSGRGYSPIFSVESEQGEHTLQRLLRYLPSGKRPGIEHVPGGTILHHGPPPYTRGPPPDQEPPHVLTSPHTSVAVGGTFDHLHIGHKLLLFGTALALTSPSPLPSSSSPSQHLTIGITSDALLRNKQYSSVLESWSTRQAHVAEFLESILIFSHTRSQQQHRTPSEHSSSSPSSDTTSTTFPPPPTDLTITYVPLHDPFGPTVTDAGISALVISGETRAGGAAVNQKRADEQGWKPLAILEVDVLDGSAAVAAEGAVQDESRDAAEEGKGGTRRDAGTGGAPGSKDAAQKAFGSKISSTEIRRRIYEAAAASTQQQKRDEDQG